MIFFAEIKLICSRPVVHLYKFIFYTNAMLGYADTQESRAPNQACGAELAHALPVRKLQLTSRCNSHTSSVQPSTADRQYGAFHR